jgi:hypothetical protein
VHYSREARRQAALVRKSLKERDAAASEPQVDARREPPKVEGAPLDRRRFVPFDSMDDDDLNRAWNQALRRIDRTKQSATLVRYKTILSDIEAEASRRQIPELDADDIDMRELAVSAAEEAVRTDPEPEVEETEDEIPNVAVDLDRAAEPESRPDDELSSIQRRVSASIPILLIRPSSSSLPFKSFRLRPIDRV